MKHDFKVCEAQSSVYSTASVTRVLAATPTDFHKFRGLPQLLNADGSFWELGLSADRAAVEREFGSTAGGEADTAVLSGRPRVILQSEPSDELGTTSLEVYPLPDALSLYANGNYRIRIPYWKFLTALSASSDTNWFTLNAEEWIAWEAAAEGFFLNWDEERATLWKQKAKGALVDVVNRDKRLRISGLQTMGISMDARGPRTGTGDT
jgi:hypothetical protein